MNRTTHVLQNRTGLFVANKAAARGLTVADVAAEIRIAADAVIARRAKIVAERIAAHRRIDVADDVQAMEIAKSAAEKIEAL
ncbi:MAG: hypothetical protein R8K47_08900 [Mariprofundaceae bacterium]